MPSGGNGESQQSELCLYCAILLIRIRVDWLFRETRWIRAGGQVTGSRNASLAFLGTPVKVVSPAFQTRSRSPFSLVLAEQRTDGALDRYGTGIQPLRGCVWRETAGQPTVQRRLAPQCGAS